MLPNSCNNIREDEEDAAAYKKQVHALANRIMPAAKAVVAKAVFAEQIAKVAHTDCCAAMKAATVAKAANPDDEQQGPLVVIAR